MRTKNSIYNMMGSMAVFIIKTVLVFLGKSCLIFAMGDEYNGLGGLFSNIISMLAIADLGIGTAIIYNLYKPIKDNNIEEIKTIMYFFKKCYHLIALVVCVIGMIIMPFLPYFVGNINIKENIYLIFILFLLDPICSYLMSYKGSLLTAHQKNYLINICEVVYIILVQIIQIFIILVTHNYYLYLICAVICRMLQNFLICHFVNIKYPYIKDKNVEQLSIKVKTDILEKVKGLLFHKISYFIIGSTDNLIISRFLGVLTVGYYSNYSIVINPLKGILQQIITSVTPSVGNLLIEGDTEKNYIVYKRLALLNFWLYTLVAIGIYYMLPDFIMIWLKKEYYLLGNSVLFILVFIIFQEGMGRVLAVFKEAGGIFYEDRYISLLESILNVIVSILLVRKYGLLGVFLGTVLSFCLRFIYSYPQLVYKPFFGKGYGSYFLEQLKWIFKWGVSFGITGIVKTFLNKIMFKNLYIGFIVQGMCITLIIALLMVMFEYRTKELRYYKEILFKRVKWFGNNKS